MAITRSQMGSQLRGDRMPAKSKKQQRFMAAVANNPEFAEEVGVPKKVGEKFMKTKKYQMGGMPQMRQAPQDESLMKGRKRRMPSMPDAPLAPPKPLPGKPKKKRQGPRGGPGMPQMPKMKKGGKVRGCGMARGGAVRPCKMVKMKGS